jgi:hypothetical protein
VSSGAAARRPLRRHDEHEEEPWWMSLHRLRAPSSVTPAPVRAAERSVRLRFGRLVERAGRLGIRLNRTGHTAEPVARLNWPHA